MYSGALMRAILVGVSKQGVGDLAGDHVELIAVGQRNDHVGIAGARPFQHVGVGSMADNGAHIEPVLQLAQRSRVDIDDRDLIGLFTGKLVGDVGAYLSGSENQNIHELVESKQSAGEPSLHQFQLGIGHYQPLGPGRLEIHLHPCMRPGALIVKHDAFAELAMAHALAQPNFLRRPDVSDC